MQTTGFKSSASMKFGDRLFGTLAKSFAWLTLILLAGIILALVYASWPSIQAFGIGFLFSDAWNPPMEDFGGLIPIYGTLVTSVIALLIAVPVSFGIALFLTEMAPAWLRRPLGTAIELLAAIPSIVYGMWGLLVFAPIFAKYIQPGLRRAPTSDIPEGPWPLHFPHRITTTTRCPVLIRRGGPPLPVARLPGPTPRSRRSPMAQPCSCWPCWPASSFP